MSTQRERHEQPAEMDAGVAVDGGAAVDPANGPDQEVEAEDAGRAPSMTSRKQKPCAARQSGQLRHVQAEVALQQRLGLPVA